MQRPNCQTTAKNSTRRRWKYLGLFTPTKYSIFNIGLFTPYNIQQVLKVGENVYVAIGYGLANSIMLEVTIIVGVVVIITILIIIKTIIIYDRGEGRRRSGHHRYSWELRSGQGGSRGLWGGEGGPSWNCLLKLLCYKNMSEHCQSWMNNKFRMKLNFWTLGDEKACCGNHSHSLSCGSCVWDCRWVIWGETSERIKNWNFLKKNFSSEFLRGREEGEVEIFAHDSFPTYFRQVTLRKLLINFKPV